MHRAFLLLLFLLTFNLNGLAEDWPMWRYDAGRTGVSADSIPSDPRLQWVRELPPVTPAYRSERLQFDRGYEPIVSGDKLFISFSHNDSVAAYDVRTGTELWRYYADGPVRLAPVAWENNVYFGADDGHVYCLDADSGTLNWRFETVPSTRKVLGNGRLISLWPVRGGPVLADGILYFAAGVWPSEGIFIYALDAATGDVVWMNDRTGFLYGRHPHNSVAMGGLTPQGYMLVNGDELIVPCGTARPAVLDRHTGELTSFSLPGEGRFPGGWFMALDTPEGRAARRGETLPSENENETDNEMGIVYDSDINRELHEDKMHVGTGEPGVSTSIVVGGKAINFSDGFEGVTGEIHTMLSAAGRLFVVTLEGELYCFGSEVLESEPVRYALPETVPAPAEDEWNAMAAQLIEATNGVNGCAVVLGVQSGRLAEELALQSDMQVIALTESPETRDRLRRRFDERGLPSERLAALYQDRDLASFGLPPYMARLIVVEDRDASGLANDAKSIEAVYKILQPYGGMAFLKMPGNYLHIWARLENARFGNNGEYVLLTKEGALPGSANYDGEWTSSDELVGSPAGILWFDDTLMHFKRAPQPLIMNGVMVSRDKVWRGEGMQAGGGDDKHHPGTGRFYLGDAGYMDAYTGRPLPEETALARAGEVQPFVEDEGRPPYQFRPPFVDEPRPPGSPGLPFHTEVDRGRMINPMTGIEEARRFIKSYGCDGGNDYGDLITMRSATVAFYDKRNESGTINISGPRSGCTNSIIPANGLLNIPCFYDGCTCSYPLPVGAALIRMPQTYEQWTAWGVGEKEHEGDARPIQRVGINLGAPGDRMTDAGTLWIDSPSVGGPSPNVSIETLPETPDYFYQHSLWIEGGRGWPWVGASGAVGLSQIQVNGLKQGTYNVRLYFTEPSFEEPGRRVFDVRLQGKTAIEALDVFREAEGKMKCCVHEFDQIEITDHLNIELIAQEGETVLCGIEIVLQGLELDPIPTLSANR
jgi:hypothetical protein